VTALLLMAIGVSTFHPLATAMVGEKAKPEKQGRDLSLFSAAGTLGLSIISLLFGWLVTLWGWRMACLLISLPGFLLAWGYAQLKNDVPVHDNTQIKLIYKNLYIVLFIAHGLRNLGTWAILSFLPTYATDYIGLRPAISAWVISLFFAGVLTGSLVMSRVLDQKSPLKFVNIATISAAFLIFILTYSTIPIIMVLLVICIGLSQGFYFPAQNTWLTRVSTNQTRGKLFGFTIFIEGLSATIAPSLYGWLADKFGLVYAYRLASIPILIAFFFYLTLYYMVKTSRNTHLRNTIS
jgi:MFS family permease